MDDQRSNSELLTEIRYWAARARKFEDQLDSSRILNGALVAVSLFLMLALWIVS